MTLSRTPSATSCSGAAERMSANGSPDTVRLETPLRPSSAVPVRTIFGASGSGQTEPDRTVPAYIRGVAREEALDVVAVHRLAAVTAERGADGRDTTQRAEPHRAYRRRARRRGPHALAGGEQPPDDPAREAAHHEVERWKRIAYQSRHRQSPGAPSGMPAGTS